MNIIDNKFLNEVEENYKENRLFTLGRHALGKNKITDLVYVKEQEQFLQNKFSIDLDKLTALDQGKSRRCWIFAGLDILRRKIALDFNLDDFKLSANYLTFYDKLEKCNFFIETMIQLIDRKLDDREVEFILRKGIRDGGFWQNFVNLINKYGIVPDYAFPETYQSNNTLEMNEILNKYMRKFTIEIRKNKDNIEALRVDTLKNVYNLLCTCLGVPPKSFDFEYVNKNKEYKIIKDIKATEFLSTYINIDLDNYCSIINYPTPEKPFKNTYSIKFINTIIGEEQNKFINLEWDRLEKMMIKQLQNKEVIYASCENGKYMNKQMGIWNENQYDYDSLFQIDTSMSKGDMLNTRECYFGHTMLITGVELENGKPFYSL